MRCARCGRRGRKVRAGRGPDGRLVFDWCRDCHAEAEFQALGLRPPAGAPGIARGAAATDPTASAPEVPEAATTRRGPRGDERALTLRALALLLVLWGLLLEVVGAGSWLGYGPADDGFGPTRINRLQLFSAAGGVLAVVGAWVGLASLDPRARRRSVARGVEIASVGLGLGVLAVGIVFHEPRRDPWVVAGVGLAVLAARAARQLARPGGHRVRSLPSG